MCTVHPEMNQAFIIHGIFLKRMRDYTVVEEMLHAW